MAQGFDHLVSKLQVRFDYYSSRTMAREALSRAGLKEQGDYSDDELQKFVDGLNEVSTNLDKVWTALGKAPSGQPLPPPPAPPAPKVEAKEPEPPPPEPEPEPVAAAPEPEPAPAPEPEPEPVVEAAAEEAPHEEAADSWFGGGKKKKKKKHGDDTPADAAPEDAPPSE